MILHDYMILHDTILQFLASCTFCVETTPDDPLITDRDGFGHHQATRSAENTRWHSHSMK